MKMSDGAFDYTNPFEKPGQEAPETPQQARLREVRETEDRQAYYLSLAPALKELRFAGKVLPEVYAERDDGSLDSVPAGALYWMLRRAEEELWEKGRGCDDPDFWRFLYEYARAIRPEFLDWSIAVERLLDCHRILEGRYYAVPPVGLKGFRDENDR
jgi:hypothetical protein